MRWLASTIVALALALLMMPSSARAHVERPVDLRVRQTVGSTLAASSVRIYRYDAQETPPICPAPSRSAGVPVDFCNYDGLLRHMRRQITAKEKDYESGLGLDYFGARYYAGAMGRFTSADAPLLDQDPLDPRSWNLYGYVRNNPLKFVDPDGRAHRVCNQDGDCGVYSDDDYDELRQNESYIVANGKIYSRNEDGTQGDQLGTAGYWGKDLSDLGQVVVGGLAERADASNQMIAGVAGLSAATGAFAAVGVPAAAGFANELALGAATGRVFYHYARIGEAGNAGRLIDETRVGRFISSLSVPQSVRNFAFRLLSRPWASGASGSVQVFAQPGRFQPGTGGTLYNVELPRLLGNPNVRLVYR